MFITLAIILLVFALAGLIILRHSELGNWSILHWLLSWLSQAFALPLAIFSAILLLYINPSAPQHWLGSALVALSLSAFLVMHFRNLAAGMKMLQQVDNAVASKPEPGQRIPALAGIAPFLRRRRGVKVFSNIAYGEDDKRNLLDVYLPQQYLPRQNLPQNPASSALPILLDIHGGGWMSGRKSTQAVPLIYHMVSKGWMCVSINYRLGPTHRFPAMLTDVLRAVAWVKENAHRYGGDPEFVVLSGGSAGGHLTTLAALKANSAALQPGFEHIDTSVQAAVPLYGRYDFVNRHDLWGKQHDALAQFAEKYVMPGSYKDHESVWELASPIAQVTAKAPPFLVIHGTHDSLIPVEEADHFFNALQKTSQQTVVYCRLDGGQHAFDMLNSALTAYHVVAVEHFLNDIHRHYKTRQQLP